MFIYDVPNKKLRRFGRKVSLLSDLMKLRGSILAVEPPKDEWIHTYAVMEPSGHVRIYVSNKSRQESKSVRLKLAGMPWPEEAELQLMTRGSGGFAGVASLGITDGAIELKLEPLSISRLRIAR